VSPFSGGGSGTPSSPPFPASAPAPPAYVESDALYWLGLLSRGTFKALLSSVHQLALLSDRGATQLATDLEYLVNVLSALGLQMPPLILKLALWLQWSEATMQTKLAEGSAGEWRLDELQPEDSRCSGTSSTADDSRASRPTRASRRSSTSSTELKLACSRAAFFCHHTAVSLSKKLRPASILTLSSCCFLS